MSTKKIKRIQVSTKGDPSVGLGGENAVIMAEGDFLLDPSCMDEPERSECIEAFRNKIAEAFEGIWGDKVNVMFDFEEPATTQLDKIRDFLDSAKGYSSQQFKDAVLNITKELLALEWVPSYGGDHITFNKSTPTTVYERVNNTPEERINTQILAIRILELSTGYVQIFCESCLGLGYNLASDPQLAADIAKKFNGKTRDAHLVKIPF